jgi:hypothetical protein
LCQAWMQPALDVLEVDAPHPDGGAVRSPCTIVGTCRLERYCCFFMRSAQLVAPLSPLRNGSTAAAMAGVANAS